MRKVVVIGAGLAALALAACDAEVSARSNNSDGDGVHIRSSTVETGKNKLRVKARLECPEREGQLRLVSAAADGRSCSYRSKDQDSEVELRLTALSGPASEHLLLLENDLRRLVPAAAQAATEAAAEADHAAAEAEHAAEEARHAAAEAGADRASIRLPGVSIEADDNGARVRVPGVEIDARDERADIRVRDGDGENVTIHADDRGAEIRAGENSGRGGDVRSTYLLASETAGPAGWKVVGFRAEGPGAGPLVVGVLRAKGRRDGDLMDEVEDLIDRNVDKR